MEKQNKLKREGEREKEEEEISPDALLPTQAGRKESRKSRVIMLGIRNISIRGTCAIRDTPTGHRKLSCCTPEETGRK